MKILLLLIAAFAIYHFWWEAIVAPTERLALRNRLFVIRDQLRTHEARGIAPADVQAFRHVHDSVNVMINRLSHLTAHNIAQMEFAYRHDAKLRARITERKALLERCEDDVVKGAFMQASRVVREAALVNGGGWAVYLLPAAVTAVAFAEIKNMASAIIAAPKQDADRLLPADV